MATLLIADVHLRAADETKTDEFLRFLQQQVPQAEALYILGDLFDAWIGDCDQPLYQRVCQALSQLPVPCYFMYGNHDFLLGQRFITESRLTLLPEPQVITLYHHRTLILHGDSLCTEDKAYQRLRYWVRQPWLQRLFLSLPLILRQKIAKQLQADSQVANQQKPSSLMAVNPQAVAALLHHYGVSRLIHGHTHRAAIHRFSLDSLDTLSNRDPLTVGPPTIEAERIVLGDWHSGSGSVLQVSASGCQLLTPTL